MKKIFKIENLDCAICASQMEEKIKKLDGVVDISINFITQKFVLETRDEVFDDIFKESKNIIKRIDSEAGIN
jgi:copper chaperone CopZ